MYNVEKLERQWVRYRQKKMIFPVGMVLFGIVALSVFLYKGTDGKMLDRNGSEARVAQTDPNLKKEAPSTSKKTEARLDILATEVPSLSPVEKQEQPKAGQIIFRNAEEEVPNRKKKRKNLLIQISEGGGKDIATDIENRFEFAKDKSDSLFLAKYYYDKMKYAKAERWALETNKLDNTIEESWLIFAKSLAKQGKRIESLKVLRAFLGKENSAKARALMDKIRRGKHF